jgi:hypothetical protein
VREKLGALGMDVIGNSPEAFAAAIKTEIPLWANLIKQTGLRQQ